MELLDGETLRAALKTGALPARKWLDYGRQIAEGLAAAHERGVTHRDLKPENLFITRDERVKILDFGLAKIAPGAPSGAWSEGDSPTRSLATGPGVVMGTIGYMAPEQVRGEPADARSDLFALGAVLYEMATGARAFTGAPVDLGAGYPLDLSPDGNSVLINRDSFRDAALIPVGVGEIRPLAAAPEQILGARFLPGGREAVFCGGPPGEAARLIRMPLAGGAATPITEAGRIDCLFAISPDGLRAAVTSQDDALRGVYSLADGSRRPVANFTATDQPLAWSDDGTALLVADSSDNTIRIARIEIASGRRTQVRVFAPPPGGFISLTSVVMAPGGHAIAYGYVHSVLSELHPIDGLK